MSAWLCAAAHISAVCPPKFSLALTSAPASSSRFAASTLPVRATAISADSPSGFLVLGSAPALSSASMIGAEPMIAASVSAVVPNWFFSFTFAPALISARTSSRSSFAAAYMIAVVPSGPGVFGLAPLASRRSAAARSPRSAASSSAGSAGASGRRRAEPNSDAHRAEATENAMADSRRRIAQTSERRPPLSPSFSTGMLLRSNSVTSRSAKRESCGYFTCCPPLILPLRVTEDRRRQRVVVVLVAVAHVAAEEDRRVIEHACRRASCAFASRSTNLANTSVW